MTDLYPRRAPNLAVRIFQGEAIIMNPTDSTLFNLNETATAIWLAADGKTSLQEIVERDIIPAFEIDPVDAMRDATDFTESLAAHSILLIADHPEGA